MTTAKSFSRLLSVALLLVAGLSADRVLAIPHEPAASPTQRQLSRAAGQNLGKPQYRKLGTRLSELAAAPADKALQARMARENNLVLEDQVPVTIRAEEATDTIEAYVRSRGGRIANVGSRVVEAYLPTGALAGLDALPSVLRVEEIVPAEPKVTSQGASVHNALNWQAADYQGQGVKVGIIDLSFDGYASLIGVEVPAPLGVRCYTHVGVFTSNLADCGGGSDHGTAVAEAVIDMAPAVSLYLADPISNLDLQNTVAWMQSEGVKVINYSLSDLWDGPGDGTSPDSDGPLVTVDWAADNGVAFVAAAGNEGMSTWFGPFVDDDGDDWAEFDDYNGNFVYLTAGDEVIIQLRWSDSWSNANRDLDLGLFNESGDLVDAGVNYQNGAPGQTPFEFIDYVAPSTGVYKIVVEHYSGTPPTWLQLQLFTSQLLEVNSGGAYSIGNPAESANPGVLAVGATAWDNNQAIEPFSSQGPTPDGRIKPDIVGVDRGDSLTRGPGGFLGTSQASPHVTGLAALLRQGYPSYTPAQIADLVRQWALPRGSVVPNNTWGSGLAFLRSVYVLTVSKTGGGAGTVSSTPAAITCGTSCVSTFFAGTGVVLSATAEAGSVFQGWTGEGCSGTGTCSVTMDGAKNVTAWYSASICSYILGSSGTSVPAAGGSGSVAVTTGPGCGWTAWSDVPWITVTDGESGTGNGTVSYSVALNHSTQSRAGTLQVGGQTFTITQGERPEVQPSDYDGDLKADVAVYRPSAGTWFSLDSSTDNTTYAARGWGVQAEGDVPVRGDFDGDGVVDPTVFRPASGTWFILESHASYTTWNWFGWGLSTDTLVPGDYDGDGKTDAAVYRPLTGEWFIRPTSGAVQWSVTFGGQVGDVPLPSDYDGDGKTDIAVYRPAFGTWFILTSSSDFLDLTYRGWGSQADGDEPAPGDYDGDGKTDLCVFRPGTGTWFILESHAGYTTWNWVGWGQATDTLVQADYDGDGKTDTAVYRTGTGEWYIRPSSGATPWSVVFGEAGDVPLQGIR
jgi:hypothetical protein